MPVKKYTNDVCFSGSTIKQGEKHAIVYATGANTFFGRAAALIGATNNVANLQKIMTKIGACCLITIGVWMVIELAVQFGHYRHACAGGESESRTHILHVSGWLSAFMGDVLANLYLNLQRCWDACLAIPDLWW